MSRKRRRAASQEGETAATTPMVSTPTTAETILGGRKLKTEPPVSTDAGAPNSKPDGGTCRCSANWGGEPCGTNMNARRTPNSAHRSICTRLAVEGSSYCHHCKCNKDSCQKARSKITKRWCAMHSDTFRNNDYCTEKAIQVFMPESSTSLKSICRANYLLKSLIPDDDIAWQEVGQSFNTPLAGSLMSSDGIVIAS